ncbi:MAG: 2-oxo-4-hydroxy-4-carboxy-5-ureidoimidazoline decarboxylase [Streptosporangiaceae bacterium]
MTSSSAAAPDEAPEGVGLAAFNALPGQRARDLLLGCCHAGHWAAAVAEGRPYGSMAELLARAHAELTGEDVAEALAGHPRIGEAPAAGQSPRARGEQAGVDAADGTVRAELAAGNRAYEERFGHIYLVCASGRGARELLAILRDRLRNDPATERQVVRAELGKINDLRLARLIGARERAS